jgi:hypothetical protein
MPDLLAGVARIRNERPVVDEHPASSGINGRVRVYLRFHFDDAMKLMAGCIRM